MADLTLDPKSHRNRQLTGTITQRDTAEVKPRATRKKQAPKAPEAETAPKTKRVSKKIQPEDFKVSADPFTAVLGFDTTARHTVSWQMGTKRNLLLAGYGVRQTEWAIAALVRHFQQHGVDRIGLDFSSFLSDYGKAAFTHLYTSRERAEETFERYQNATEPVAIIIAAGGNMLQPTYVEPDLREISAHTSERLVDLLGKLLANPNVYVIFASSKLHEEAALPAAFLADFETVVLSSKIFLRDAEHMFDAAKRDEALALSAVMRPTQNILLPAEGRGEIFESFRVPLR